LRGTWNLAEPSCLVLFEKGYILHTELHGLFSFVSGAFAGVLSHSEQEKESNEAKVSYRLHE
jgi:hypothetical protein